MARGSTPSAHSALETGSAGLVRDRSLGSSLFLSLRPGQWTKNMVVYAGLIFSQKLLDPHALATSTAAFATFCVLSGVVYLINDVRDREADRLHPVKCRRPIAAGHVSPTIAVALAAILAGCGIAAAFSIRWQFGLVGLSYLLLQGFYSITIKHVVILDVLAIALGFVLRAVAGTIVLDVPISHWLLVLTLLGALFLALSKRRAELVALTDAASHRKSLQHYSVGLLDQMISIVAACTLLAYAFYTISPETTRKFGTENLLFTLPFPLYGMFRYLYLSYRCDGGGDPSETLLHDRPILACVVLWAITIALIIYRPWP